jgi:hypothetical protein
MLAILHLLLTLGADIFKSRRRFEAENLFLRHQLNDVTILVGCVKGRGARLDNAPENLLIL